MLPCRTPTESTHLADYTPHERPKRQFGVSTAVYASLIRSLPSCGGDRIGRFCARCTKPTDESLAARWRSKFPAKTVPTETMPRPWKRGGAPPGWMAMLDHQHCACFDVGSTPELVFRGSPNGLKASILRNVESSEASSSDVFAWVLGIAGALHQPHEMKGLGIETQPSNIFDWTRLIAPGSTIWFGMPR